MKEGRNSLTILTGTPPAGKRILGKPRCRWENYIRMDLKQVSIRGIGLIRLRIAIIVETL